MSLSAILPALLLMLGVGFFVANLRVTWLFVKFSGLRSAAVLTWQGPRPPYYGLILVLGVVFALLILFKLVIQERLPTQTFGEGMMFLYYSCAVPLSLRIARGFYENGIWAESGFVLYSEIGGLTWRENNEITLVVNRMDRLARRLVVPKQHYGEARRLLRDKIASDDLRFSGKSLDLGRQDERDGV